MNHIEKTTQIPSTNTPESVLEAALDYCKRGWSVVPIPYKTKAPIITGWQKLRLTEAEISKRFKGKSNIGVLVGEPSGGLVDIDLDCDEACELADEFLPPTCAEFGHGKQPRSHRLYQVVGSVEYKAYTFKTGKRKGKKFIERRSGTGKQTVFPPSVHPPGN